MLADPFEKEGMPAAKRVVADMVALAEVAAEVVTVEAVAGGGKKVLVKGALAAVVVGGQVVPELPGSPEHYL